MPDDAPKYRAIAAKLRADIASGSLPVGGRMPTKNELAADNGVALGTIDRALEDLRREGLIKSEQGAGTFILRSPDAPEDIPGRLEELRGEVEGLRKHGTASEAAVLERVGRIEAALIDLYGKLGFEYPGKSRSRRERTAAGQ